MSLDFTMLGYQAWLQYMDENESPLFVNTFGESKSVGFNKFLCGISRTTQGVPCITGRKTKSQSTKKRHF
jgi:hypothetical protein